MPINYTVKPGDCVSSIAFNFGFLPDTIWNDAANADLKDLRKDPNILKEGDVVVIPEKRTRSVARATDASHRFVLKGVPATLRLQLFDGTTPRASQSFRLIVDGRKFEGTTDGNGVLEVSIRPDAGKGELTIGPDMFQCDLDFGALDPITEISGIQARLNNIGYNCGPVDGKPSDRLRRMLLMFQSVFGLQGTGEADDSTINKLREIHDRVSNFPEDPSSTATEDSDDQD
jgi:Putative peptidoglycan binding domain/LysM domain